jgi:hypothetical protein
LARTSEESVERFERIGVGWFATCIVGGLAVVAAGLIAASDYPPIGWVLAIFGSLAILVGIAGIVAEVVVHTRAKPAESARRSDPAFRAASSDARRRLIRTGERLLDVLARETATGVAISVILTQPMLIGQIHRWDSNIDACAYRYGWSIEKSHLYKATIRSETWRRDLRAFVLERVETLNADDPVSRK